VTFSNASDRRNASAAFYYSALLSKQAGIRDAMGRIESLVRASLPPSPLPSPRNRRRAEGGDKDEAAETSTPTAAQEEETTPTKVLDVAKRH